MPPKKEDNLVIRQFKDKSSNFFIGFKHYALNENNDLIFVCGGIEDEKETEVLRQYIKRNKKTYIAREKVVEIAYNEVIGFGQHKNKTIIDVPKQYLQWMIKNYTFKQNETALKEEIIRYLK